MKKNKAGILIDDVDEQGNFQLGHSIVKVNYNAFRKFYFRVNKLRHLNYYYIGINLYKHEK